MMRRRDAEALVQETVRENPGIYRAELVRTTGLHGEIQRWLGPMLRRGELRIHREGRLMHLFPPNVSAVARERLTLLRAPNSNSILELLWHHGPLTSQEIIDTCSLAPETIRSHLARLVKARLVTRIRGIWPQYQANEATIDRTLAKAPGRVPEIDWYPRNREHRYFLRHLQSPAPAVKTVRGTMKGEKARGRILRFVEEYPGAMKSSLHESLGISWGALTYHLNVMHADGRIHLVKQASQLHVYTVTRPLEQLRQQSLLRDELVQRILKHLQDNPGDQLLTMSAALCVSRKTVRRMLGLMLDVGLVEAEGKRKRMYWMRDAAKTVSG
jgi:predicted transcriptional regulator